MPAVSRVRIENTTPARLVRLVLEGRIRLPAFQRGYRWRARDVENLFDSVIRSYPVGILLLWERPAPAERISIGPLVLDVPEVATARWVVDGQQRITSLVGALAAPPGSTDPRFAVHVHLPTLEVRAAATPPTGPWLPLRVVLSPRDLLAWRQSNSEWLGRVELDAIDEIVTALQDYPIPSYITEVTDEREMLVIFERLNTSGRSLRRAEVFDALHGVHDGAEPATLRSVGDAVAATGFGRLTDEDVLRTLLALRGPDVARNTRSEFATDDDGRRAFALTERVLLDVIAMVRDDLFVPHVRALPHASVVPLLAAIVYRFGRPSGRAAVLLRRWFWRAAAMGVNPVDGQGRLGRALHTVAGSADVQAATRALLAELPAPPRHWLPDLAQVQLNRAPARVNLLGLIALEPRELVRAATELPLPNPAIAPADLLDTSKRPLVRIVPERTGLGATLANRILHPALDGSVVDALLAADTVTRASHAVDERCSRLLAAGEFIAALDHRSGLLRSTIARVVDERAEWGARDRPTAAEMLGPLSA